MPAPRVRGNYVELNQITQTFGANATQLKNTLQKLKSAQMTLVNGDWVGKGATAFYREMDGQVLPALQRLVNALQQARATTRQISAIISQTEQEVAALFKENATIVTAGGAGGGGNSSGPGTTAAGNASGLPAGAIPLPNSPQAPTNPPSPVERLAQVLSVIATALDITSFALSASGALLEAVGGAIGLVFPLPAGDEVVGFGAGVAIYNAVINPLENTLSAGSFALVAVADILTGATHIEGNELIFGPDTTFSALGIALGNTPCTPEAISDSIVNAGVIYYDIQRLRNQEPAWGLTQLRLGFGQDGRPYMRVTDETGQDKASEILGWFKSIKP